MNQLTVIVIVTVTVTVTVSMTVIVNTSTLHLTKVCEYQKLQYVLLHDFSAN